MPCRDGGPCEEPGPSLQQRLDNVTDMLCRTIQIIDENASENFTLDDLPRSVQEWWKEHKEADKKRAAEEKRVKEANAKSIKESIAKLKKQLKDMK